MLLQGGGKRKGKVRGEHEREKGRGEEKTKRVHGRGGREKRKGSVYYIFPLGLSSKG